MYTYNGRQHVGNNEIKCEYTHNHVRFTSILSNLIVCIDVIANNGSTMFITVLSLVGSSRRPAVPYGTFSHLDCVIHKQ